MSKSISAFRADCHFFQLLRSFLENHMGRMPKIAIGDTVEFDGGYPKGNVVRIHSYGDTFFIDFEI